MNKNMTTFKTVAWGLGLTLSYYHVYAQDSLIVQPNESFYWAEADTSGTFSGNEMQANSLEAPGQSLPGHPIFNATLLQSPNTWLYTRPHDKITLNTGKADFFLSNRRNRYSALWAFTSLNYLYADLVNLMDKNILKQYQSGVVDGTRITPGFLTLAAGFMQVPLANVFLPQVIKNEKTLRWVQIASGTLMTLVQSGTLFMGKPAPHYVLFSTIEIGTTAYIAIDAIRWKPRKK